jgi:hypothetical protein
LATRCRATSICNFRLDRMSEIQVLEGQFPVERGRTIADFFRKMESEP